MYQSSHGQFEDRGQSMQTTITGQGLLPCGDYKKCEVLSISTKDGKSTLIAESHRGSHVEDISPPLPKWVEQGATIDILITLGNGVYARRNSKGQLALFDASTQEQKCGWTTNIIPYLHKHTMSEPSISIIKCGDLIWERATEAVVNGKLTEDDT